MKPVQGGRLCDVGVRATSLLPPQTPENIWDFERFIVAVYKGYTDFFEVRKEKE